MKTVTVPSKKAVVTKMCPALAQAIPHAKPFTYKGKELLAVPHGTEELQVLSNMGYRNVPHPIRHYYDWPGKYQPMKHQIDTASFLASRRRGICLNAPGTGKTLSSLWAADYLLGVGVVKRVLIVAPLSTLKPVWGSELMQHFFHRQFTMLVGPRAKRLRLLADSTAEFLIVNHDGFTTLSAELAGVADLIIYDEATALKTPGSQRYKTFNAYLREFNPWLWLMTGTPISQNPVDAWTLARMINSPTVPSSYHRFKEETMRKITQFKWVPRPDAIETVKAALQPSIRYSLDECVELPETVVTDKPAELTKAQQVAYKELTDEAEITWANISAANAAVLMQKLLQVCCGVAYDEDRNRVNFDDTLRLQVLTDTIAEIGDKCIVFCPLRGVQDRVAEHLTNKGYDIATVHGDVSKKERDRIFDTFQNTGTIKILVAHPKVAAHGLTLTRADSIVWYAPIHSLEQYEQANARIRRMNTGGKTHVYHVYASGFERAMYTRLKEKQRVLSDFLALVRGIND